MSIRHALPSDVDTLAEIEAASYPSAEGASRQSIAGRVAVYPDCFWLLDEGGEVKAFVNGFVTDTPDLTDEMYDDPHLHTPKGGWQMIFSVVTAPALDLAPLQMLRTKQYWLCAGAVCCSTPAVLLFSPIILKLGMERGLDEGAALWSVVLGSVGSAAGRLLMPLLSDRIGRRPTDLILFGVSLGLSAAFLFAQGWLVVAVYAGLTFCYSALAAVLPSLSTDLFGLPHAGVNYGFLALGQSVGSLALPFAANLWGLATERHWLAMAGAAAGFVCIWALRPVRAQQPPRKN